MASRTIGPNMTDAELAVALHVVLAKPINGKVSVFRQQVLDLLVTNADAIFAYPGDEGDSDG